MLWEVEVKGRRKLLGVWRNTAALGKCWMKATEPPQPAWVLQGEVEACPSPGGYFCMCQGRDAPGSTLGIVTCAAEKQQAVFGIGLFLAKTLGVFGTWMYRISSVAFSQLEYFLPKHRADGCMWPFKAELSSTGALFRAGESQRKKKNNKKKNESKYEPSQEDLSLKGGKKMSVFLLNISGNVQTPLFTFF